MVLPYSRFKTKYGIRHRPILTVVLRSGTASISTKGLIDSGADRVLVNKAFAKSLGVDLKKCPVCETVGINGLPQKTWVARIDLEVENLPNSKHSAEVEFIDSKSVGVLLGTIGFLEDFSVKFEAYLLIFEIDNKP